MLSIYNLRHANINFQVCLSQDPEVAQKSSTPWSLKKGKTTDKYKNKITSPLSNFLLFCSFFFFFSLCDTSRPSKFWCKWVKVILLDYAFIFFSSFFCLLHFTPCWTGSLQSSGFVTSVWQSAHFASFTFLGNWA